MNIYVIHVHRKHVIRKIAIYILYTKQIHFELDKIQSLIINNDNDTNDHQNKPSKIDPFIIIAPNDDQDDEKKIDDSPSHTIRNDTLTRLEPFQCLVNKIQNEINPNNVSSDESDPKQQSKTHRRRSSIKMKQSELDTISDYVREHKNKMKEKTYQYEEKKKQLQNAKDRLNKANARFTRRLTLNYIFFIFLL